MSKIRTVLMSSLAIGSLLVAGAAPHSAKPRPDVHSVAVAGCCPDDGTQA
jgi:hypothetical protein